MLFKYILPAGVIIALLLGAYYRGASDKETELTQQYQQAYIDQFTHYRQVEQDLQSQIAQLDEKHMGELLDAQANIDDVLASVRTGERRLYVNTTKNNCPVPKNPTATSLDHATSRAELDQDTSQQIIQLTARGDTAIRQLTACQDYVRKIQNSQ